MSPHPDHSLDVQKYVGSYLISSQTNRGKSNPTGSARHFRGNLSSPLDRDLHHPYISPLSRPSALYGQAVPCLHRSGVPPHGVTGVPVCGCCGGLQLMSSVNPLLVSSYVWTGVPFMLGADVNYRHRHHNSTSWSTKVDNANADESRTTENLADADACLALEPTDEIRCNREDCDDDVLCNLNEDDEDDDETGSSRSSGSRCDLSKSGEKSMDLSKLAVNAHGAPLIISKARDFNLGTSYVIPTHDVRNSGRSRECSSTTSKSDRGADDCRTFLRGSDIILSESPRLVSRPRKQWTAIEKAVSINNSVLATDNYNGNCVKRSSSDTASVSSRESFSSSSSDHKPCTAVSSENDVNPPSVVSSGATISDCRSITSEDSSGTSESMLPRVIKPRKRRRKDKKNVPNGFVSRHSYCSSGPPSGSASERSSSSDAPPGDLLPRIPIVLNFDSDSYSCTHFRCHPQLSSTQQDKLKLTKKHSFDSLAVMSSPPLDNVLMDLTKATFESLKIDADENYSELRQSGRNFFGLEDEVTKEVAKGGHGGPPCPPGGIGLEKNASGADFCYSAGSPGPSTDSHSSSAFLTPPLSPLAGNVTSDSDYSHSQHMDVSTRIVTAAGGTRDLEIRFLPANSKGHSGMQSLSTTVQCSPSSRYPEGSAKDFLSNSSKLTTTRPPQRPWITLGQPERGRPTSIFTVMCYNILCDKLATRQLYGYCPNWALTWDYRRKAIMDEIKTYSADIISLQEVETEQFYNFFLPELQREGYDGIFSPKSRAKTMSENERKHVDGCAIFFRTSKFSLIKEHLVEFNQLAMANAEGSDDMLNRVMTKDNIGLAALLQTKEGAFEPGMLQDPSQAHQPLLVCTAHIHWDPEYCDVKLIQTIMLMHELKQIVEESAHSFRPGAQKPDTANMPLILCGDLNSLPDSGVVEFLTSGRICANHADFKELGYKDCLKKLSSTVSEGKNDYTHPFRVTKAYPDDIMPFTNFTFDFKGVIDYIFYTKQHMTVLGLLGPVDATWLKENKVGGCPHPHIPSDHFPLLVEFELTPPAMSLSHLSNGIMLRR